MKRWGERDVGLAAQDVEGIGLAATRFVRFVIVFVKLSTKTESKMEARLWQSED